MRTSNIIKRSLGDNERAQLKFTLSDEYIKIGLGGAILKYLLIISVLTAVLLFLFNSNQNQTSVNNDPYFFDYNQEMISPVKESSNNWLIWTAVGVFFLIILPILLFYYLYYLRISHEYVFTNHRILIKRGWISNKTISIHYNRITDVSINQNIIDRILKIGSVSISTAGSEGYKAVLAHVSKPHQIKRRLYSLKESYRQGSRQEDFNLDA